MRKATIKATLDGKRILLVAALAVGGCGGGPEGTDTGDVPWDDAEVAGEAAADGDADADVLVDVPEDVSPDVPENVDGDGDADAYPSRCAGGWYDSVSGMCWQEPAATTMMEWNTAMAYCNNLDLGGHGPGSWHLPTISELRSLIQGCPTTRTGGTCGVTDSCLDEGCWESPACESCEEGHGAGAGGFYWPPELAAFDEDDMWFWSSSSCSGSGCSSEAWFVSFSTGFVYHESKTYSANVRCVRPGP